jgi:hypothetical protein
MMKKVSMKHYQFLDEAPKNKRSPSKKREAPVNQSEWKRGV